MSYLRIKVGKETHKRSMGIYYEVEVRSLLCAFRKF